MTRDEIVEVMARALAEHDGRDPDAAATWFGGNKIWVEYESDAKAALSALDAAGMRVVPVEPSEWSVKTASLLHTTPAHECRSIYRAMLAASQEDVS